MSHLTEAAPTGAAADSNPSTILASARRALELYRLQEEGVDPHTVVFPPSAFPELLRATASSVRKSSRQVLPFKGTSQQSQSFEDTTWRYRAESGVAVDRVYVLPHRASANESFRLQLDQDRQAGVKSSSLVLSAIPQDDMVNAIEELWILDDAVAVIAKPVAMAGDGGTRWTVTDRSEDLAYARATWARVQQLVAAQPRPPPGAVDLEEPLALSADLIGEVAGVLCTSDQVDGQSCSWYHSAWQYLRLLDLVSTPTWHVGFYVEELAKGLRGVARPKAAVTGCADYSMLAFLRAAYDNVGAEPSLHVLDRCPTPLFACKWYAHHFRFPVRTYEEDLFVEGGSLGSGFDLVCADALLTRFSPSDTRRVLARWFSLLNPGGSLVTTIRIHPRSPSATEPETAVQRFRQEAVRRSMRWQTFLRRAPAEIGELAEVYARRMHSEDLGSEIDIRSLLEAQGFKVQRFQLANVPGELHPTVYLEVSALRPG